MGKVTKYHKEWCIPLLKGDCINCITFSLVLGNILVIS